MDGRVDANARHQGSPLPSASGWTDVVVRSLTEPITTTPAGRIVGQPPARKSLDLIAHVTVYAFENSASPQIDKS
jgi:hypothetical protein